MPNSTRKLTKQQKLAREAKEAKVPQMLAKQRKVLNEFGDAVATLGFLNFNPTFRKEMDLVKITNEVEKLVLHIEKLEKMMKEHKYYDMM